MTTARIRYEDGELIVPDAPELAFLPGDGIGPEVWSAARPVFDAAVKAAYGGKRRIEWRELPAGQSALDQGLDLLPATTVEQIRELRVAIKGPTMTPVGGGHRSINVALRQALDLYANVRPVHYYEGVISPMREPRNLDVVIFRENTEDVYAGIEFEAGTDDAKKLAAFLAKRGHQLRDQTGIGIKIISREGSQRLVRAAMLHAVANGKKRVTLVHKGNIMKSTEGAFRAWGFELVREEFGDRAVVAADLPTGTRWPDDKIVVDDRIADTMFQDLLLRPKLFQVIASPNLNGDYLSDASAAQVGGLGIAPGGNMGDGIALFESTHGTAPDIAGKGLANPGSMMLSGAMMLHTLGWTEAAERLEHAFAGVLASGRMTPDLAAGRDGVTALSTSEFGEAVARATRAV